jgi:16S rRNA (cytosine967-C5)-methyltransferase
VSFAGSQKRTLLALLSKVRPHWRSDAALPARIDFLLRGDRRLGSRDRRLYRELIYTAVRYLPWVEPLLDSAPEDAVARAAWLSVDAPAFRAFREAVAGGFPPCPSGALERAQVLGADAGALTPSWALQECPDTLVPPLLDVLLSRAPLWVRLQTSDEESVLREFERLGWAWRRSPLLPGAVALPMDASVQRTDSYRLGRIEIQDVGSQLVLESVGLVPGGHWLDACAGAGGKTLQLAFLLGPRGRVTARDTRSGPMDELSARAARAGLQERILVGVGDDPAGGFDGVLVDAPCSGSGTWRRSPHLKWVTTEGSIRKAASLQLELLRAKVAHVKPGGLLVYSTCSLCRSENESVVEDFLRENSLVEPVVAGRRLVPQTHDGDGFFVALFRRPRKSA